MRKLSLLLLLIIGSLLYVPVASSATITFNDAGFANTWNRVDKPVADSPNPTRGYTWGPGAPGTENITSEPYNNATRKVQYFDKARMEINDPSGNPNYLFYVTTGLLVKEMVSGLRQDGDNLFTQLGASSVQIAGDSNTNGANAISPTYASFRGVATIINGENTQPQIIGGLISARLDKNGKVSQVPSPEVETHFFKGYDNITHHNIADVFIDFGNQRGLVWNGSVYVTDDVFFGNSLYVLGRPITEPYWIRAVVAGKEQDVLVQLFERRVLTYTPANPANFRVEMGNVGQHYYQWRYAQPQPVLLASKVVAPIVASNYLFWKGENQSIYGYDLSKKEQFLIKENVPVSTPLTSDGTTLAWLEDAPNDRIQGYDLKTRQEFTIVATNSQSALNNPALYNGVLYYNDLRSTHKGFFAHNIANEQEKQILNKLAGNPMIVDSILLWNEEKFLGDFVPAERSLHFLKLDGSQGDTIIAKAGAQLSNYAVSGDKIVWSYYPPALDNRVYLYSIKDGTSKPISTNQSSYPVINSNWIAWTDETDTASGGKNSIEGYNLTNGNIKTLVASSTFTGGSSLQPWGFVGQNTLIFTSNNDGNTLYTLDLAS